MAHDASIFMLIANANAEEVKTTTIGMRLVFSGCRVEAVYSAEEVLEWSSKHTWDVVLVDEQLLEQDWTSAIPEIRRRARSAVIIALTDHNDIGIAMQAIRAGVDHCFYKKASSFMTELPVVTKTLLEKRQSSPTVDRTMDRFVPLAEHMTEIVYELDAEGRFVNISPGVVALLGYRPEELIGTHYSQLVPAEELHIAEHHLNERRTGDRATRNAELHLVAKPQEGSPPQAVEVELTAMGLYDQHRRMLGTVGVIRDVRSRKRLLQQHEDQLRQEYRRREEQLARDYHAWEAQLEQELKRREDAVRLEHQEQEERLRNEQVRLRAELEQELQRREEEWRDKYKEREEQLREEQTRLGSRWEQELGRREEELRLELSRREEKFHQERQALQQQLEDELRRREEQLHQEYRRQIEQLDDERHPLEAQLRDDLQRQKEQEWQQVEEATSTTSHVQTIPDEPKNGHSAATVLIVEPQEAVVGLTRTLLQQHRYTVISAPSAADALGVCKSYQRSIHVLLTDVGKPGTISIELAGRLIAMRPAMKVLYLSGYHSGAKGNPEYANRGIYFLEKPFSPEALVQKIADIVDVTASTEALNVDPVKLSALP